MNFDLQQHIETQINQILLTDATYKWTSVSGGSINNAYKLSSGELNYFVKTNTISVFENGFKEEVLGLEFLNKNEALVPKIIAEGRFKNAIYLVLDWIETGNKTSVFWNNFAEQLANLHQHKSHQFGLDYSNFMGQLPQKNTFFDDFIEFFIENRLKPQVVLAFNNGLLQKKHLQQFQYLYKQLPSIFPKEKPCAVHGDLWSGNFMNTIQQKAVLIDPAVYYGHREVDLAMSTLFGGFSYQFYQTYNEIYPLAIGFDNRKEFYNLYPLLIHLNLFGSSYLSSITRIISYF